MADQDEKSLSSPTPDESTPLWIPRHIRHPTIDSSFEDIVIQSIQHIGEEIQAITHDLSTFQPLDTDELAELAAEAEASGAFGLSVLDTTEEKEDAIDPSQERPAAEHSLHRKLGVLPLAVIVFYNVSGGPFGVETAVRAGGNLFALLGFVIGPLVWSVQEALLTAELGTTFPEAGAGVAWVEEAFGPSAGWMCGYLGWIAGATDNAIYPVLFLDYLLQHVNSSTGEEVGMHPMIRFGTLAFASITLGYINWRGLHLVGEMSVWIGLIAMSPFLVLIVAGSFQVDPRRWLELPNNDSGGSILGGVLWGPFLNNLFWNLNSFDAAGSFAGEIENAGVMFPRAMRLSVILVATCYVFPLLVAIGASSAEREDWTDGYLAVVAGDVVGPWLGAWTVFAAAISNVALFQAELSADSYQLMGMADRGHLPKILSKRSRHGTSTFGIILGVAVIVVMDFLSDFDQLIEMLNFSYAIALLMEYAAFVKLRVSQPDLKRPYRIPLNTFGCILFFSPSILLILLVLALANNATYLMFAGVALSGILIFSAKQRSQRNRQSHEGENGQDSHQGSIEAVTPDQR